MRLSGSQSALNSRKACISSGPNILGSSAARACPSPCSPLSDPPKLKTRSAARSMNFREFIDRAADLVLSFGGSLSGEHGDGQSRAALLPKMFGPELMQAFREFKALWDPDNRMNPGKVVDAVRVYDPLENLRHGPVGGTANGHAAAEFETHFCFAKDEGSLERATERCVGVGACRKASGGVMCPSYRATGD